MCGARGWAKLVKTPVHSLRRGHAVPPRSSGRDGGAGDGALLQGCHCRRFGQHRELDGHQRHAAGAGLRARPNPHGFVGVLSHCCVGGIACGARRRWVVRAQQPGAISAPPTQNDYAFPSPFLLNTPFPAWNCRCHTDLLAAGVIGEPFNGTNPDDQKWVAYSHWTYENKNLSFTSAMLSHAHVHLVSMVGVPPTKDLQNT